MNNNNILIPKYIDGEYAGSIFIDSNSGNQELNTISIKDAKRKDTIDALIYTLSLKENESPFPSDMGINIKDILGD